MQHTCLWRKINKHMSSGLYLGLLIYEPIMKLYPSAYCQLPRPRGTSERSKREPQS
jgi:hypothetical protein